MAIPMSIPWPICEKCEESGSQRNVESGCGPCVLLVVIDSRRHHAISGCGSRSAAECGRRQVVSGYLEAIQAPGERMAASWRKNVCDTRLRFATALWRVAGSHGMTRQVNGAKDHLFHWGWVILVVLLLSVIGVIGGVWRRSRALTHLSHSSRNLGLCLERAKNARMKAAARRHTY